MKVEKRKYGQTLVEKIPKYKMDVLNQILESDEITKLISYDTPDAPYRKSLTQEQRDELLYERVFPFRFVPDAIENQGTFITMGVGRVRMLEEGYTVYDDYQSGQVTFYIFTHVDLMRTHGGIRQDLVLAEISKIFDKNRTLGIGELKIRSLDELWIHNNKFGGYTISFSMVDI